MSLLLFRLYDDAHPGLYGFVGAQENQVLLERINPKTLEPTVFGTTTDSRKVLQAIADVRNEIVDSYPGLDAIQLAEKVINYLRTLEEIPYNTEVSYAMIQLTEELSKWKPLITMFHHEATE